MSNRPTLRLVPAASGKKVYTCAVCGIMAEWSQGWMWYGSLKDLDDGRGIPCYCPVCAKETKP